MKNLIFLLSFIVVILLSAIFIGSTELKNLVRLKQSEINGLKKANKIERDSLNKILKVTKDSLSIAYETIRVANKERHEAHERTQRMIKNYEKIIFIRYTSDSARHRKLSELYPSYRIH